MNLNRTQILWRQVWGLAALLAAIIFSFTVYSLYQPKILQNLGFVGLANWLGIVQGSIGAVIEPSIGGLSDRIMRRLGSRLPIISVGVTLAGLLFVALSLLIQGHLPLELRWLVPVLMTLWVMAMVIFRGPAIALLRQFAPTAELPKADAILVLVLGLVGAVGPPLGVLLEILGPSIAFVLGAMTLVIGALLMYSTTPQYTPILTDVEAPQPFPPILLLSSIFVVGLTAGLEINVLLGIFPQVLKNQLAGSRSEYISSGILLVSALTAVPLGQWTAKLGIVKAMLAGLGTIAGLMGLTIVNQNSIVAVGFILTAGAAFGLIFISQIPFALGLVPPNRAGLSTGIYFGGIGAASAISSVVMRQPGGMTATAGFWWAAIAFSIAAPCLAATKKLQSAQLTNS